VGGGKAGGCVCWAKAIVAIEKTNEAQTRDVLDIPAMRFIAAQTVTRNYIASVCMRAGKTIGRYPVAGNEKRLLDRSVPPVSTTRQQFGGAGQES
jgi:hypothetical protein